MAKFPTISIYVNVLGSQIQVRRYVVNQYDFFFSPKDIQIS